jgi:hypothetical protein
VVFRKGADCRHDGAAMIANAPGVFDPDQ